MDPLHVAMLDAIVDALAEKLGDREPTDDDAWEGNALTAFRGMRARGYPLTSKQIDYINGVADRIGAIIPRPPAPRGREVALAFDNMPKPAKPPGKKTP